GFAKTRKDYGSKEANLCQCVQHNNVEENVPLKKVELLRLGRRIRRARHLLGLTQSEFAARCGLDRSYFGGVERGNRNITFGVICAICHGLACDIAAVTVGIPEKHGLIRAATEGLIAPSH